MKIYQGVYPKSCLEVKSWSGSAGIFTANPPPSSIETIDLRLCRLFILLLSLDILLCYSFYWLGCDADVNSAEKAAHNRISKVRVRGWTEITAKKKNVIVYECVRYQCEAFISASA